MKQIIILTILFVLIVAGFILIRSAKPAKVRNSAIKVGSVVFRVDVADNFASRAQGLSGRTMLNGDQGMLFIFPVPGPYSFWMKGMNFPIDIIWISDKKVIGFAENVPVPSGVSVSTVSPPGMVDQALEISAGLVKQRGIKVGDEVAF